MPGKHIIVLAILAVAISLLYLSLPRMLSSQHTGVTQAEQSARNTAASSLYTRLATLPAPPADSAIARVLHEFVTANKIVDGATVLDNNGHLVAHLGSGNDTLTETPTGSHTARVPIMSDVVPHGHVVLAFKRSAYQTNLLFHYSMLALLSVMLSALLCGLMAAHSRAANALFER